MGLADSESQRANHHLNYWPVGIAKDCSPYHACTFNDDLPHLGGPSHTDSSTSPVPHMPLTFPSVTGGPTS